MYQVSLSQNLSQDHMYLTAGQVGLAILKLDAKQVEPILAYGNHLLNHTEPTSGDTLRFFGALKRAAADIPELRSFVARHASQERTLSAFQCQVALFVAVNSSQAVE